VRRGDAAIDALEEQINEECARLIALRGPIATDLRTVLTVMKIAASWNAAATMPRTWPNGRPCWRRWPAIGVRRVGAAHGQGGEQMLKDALDAYIARDAALAADVRQRDQDVDQMYNALFREFLTHMLEDPRNITACMHLHFIAKNIERMGDHATGIAEQVIYLVTGEMPDDARPKGDSTAFDRLGQRTTGMNRMRRSPPSCSGRGRKRPARSPDLQPRGRRLQRRHRRQRRRGAAAGGGNRPRHHRAGLDAAQCVGDRGLPPPEGPPRNPRHPDHHAVGPVRGGGPRARPGNRRRRLCDQTLFGGRTDGPRAHAVAPGAPLDRGVVLEWRASFWTPKPTGLARGQAR
jgi:phosphate transport system protein